MNIKSLVNSLSYDIDLMVKIAKGLSKALILNPDSVTLDFFDFTESVLNQILDNWGQMDSDIRRGLYDQVRNAIDIVNTSRLLGRMLKESSTFDPKIIIHLHNKLINE